MDHETVYALCERQPHAEASSPFGPDNVVFKVAGKMFALISLDVPRVNLKCDPERAERLRERHPGVTPGYHMSKRHWNSVLWEEETFDAGQLEGWVRESYDLVVASLTRKQRALLRDLDGAPDATGA